MTTTEQVTTEQVQRMIREAGLRATRPRVAVLSVVSGHPHADTESIIGEVRENLPTVSHQAVYDCLHAMTDAGLLRRIQPAGSVARYETRVGDNHHHVVCRTCGAIEDVDCAVGETPCLIASDAHGYEIDEAEVVYWGQCATCAAATPVAAPPETPPATPPATTGVTPAGTPQDAPQDPPQEAPQETPQETPLHHTP